MKTKHNLMTVALGTAFITVALGGLAHAAVDGSTGVNMFSAGKITNAPPTTNANSVTNTGTSWEFSTSLQGFVVPASQLTGLTTTGGTLNYEDLLPIKANKLSVVVGAAGAAPTGVGTIIDSAGIETNGLELLDTATSSAVALTVTNGILSAGGSAVAAKIPTISISYADQSPGTSVGQLAYNTLGGTAPVGLMVWSGTVWKSLSGQYVSSTPGTPSNTSPAMDMVSIPSGTLTTQGGSAVNVAISAFTMARTHTTLAQWQTVRTWALSNGYNLGAGANGPGGDATDTSRPVASVSWYDCVKWCNALSEKQGYTPAYYVDENRNGTYDAGTDTVFRTGEPAIASGSAIVANSAATGYKLPSDSQWEWAARGGNMTANIYPWGTTTIDSTYANYGNNVGFTTPVGNYPNGRNPYGLDDMAGNLWQYTSEFAGDTPYIRGGSYHNSVNGVITHNRSAAVVTVTFGNTGFRVIK